MESIQQTINGTVAEGSRNSVTIPRNGDLVGRMYWRLVLAAEGAMLLTQVTYSIGVELENWRSAHDKHFGHWMEAQLTEQTAPVS